MNQIYHNLNGGSPGNAVDELIDYFEEMIKGPIIKLEEEEKNPDGTAKPKAYCKESGMEPIWLAKSKPRGLLAKTEGWENNPAGGMMRRGPAYLCMFQAFIANGSSMTAKKYNHYFSSSPARLHLVAQKSRFDYGGCIQACGP